MDGRNWVRSIQTKNVSANFLPATRLLGRWIFTILGGRFYSRWKEWRMKGLKVIYVWENRNFG